MKKIFSFKGILLVFAGLITLSAVYYFVIFLPKAKTYELELKRSETEYKLKLNAAQVKFQSELDAAKVKHEADLENWKAESMMKVEAAKLEQARQKVITENKNIEQFNQCTETAHKDYENLWNENCKQISKENGCSLPLDTATFLDKRYNDGIDSCSTIIGIGQ